MHSLVNRLRAQRAESEEGLTLIELVVSMMIFTIVLGIYFSALMSMSRTTVEAQDTVDAADNLRATFNALDHQVRYATSINRPGTGPSGAWYVEFEATDLPDNQPALCYQWRFDPAAESTAYRLWTQDGVSSAGDWHTVSWDIQAADGLDPFEFSPAGGTILKQTMTVNFQVVGARTGEVAAQSTTFVARNSSYQSPSNEDANHDGVSDTPVCLSGMSRS